MTEELFIPSMQFCKSPAGRSLFPDYAAFHYHIQNVLPRLIREGAMVTVGIRMKVRPNRFMEVWQEISAERAEEKMKQA